MRMCRRCRGRLHREHRRWWQKLVHRSIYVCDDCGAQDPHPHKYVRYFSIHPQCPRCCSDDLKVHGKLDRVDTLQSGFFRRIQSWVRAPLYYCDRCRLQFYDLRPLPRSGAVAESP